jgi:hypothetical protein
MKAIILLLLSFVSVSAQSSKDLREKFGAPKSEVFQVRPNINMTVTYGKTGVVCAMVLEPTFEWMGAYKMDEATTFIEMSVVTKLFDQLVPKERRGSLISGPREGPHVEWIYQHVNLLVDGRMDAARRAIIALKSDACK